jgi:hypothetical protein
MGIPNSKRSGGPRSPEGKATASRNAFTTGLAATRWYHPQEEAEYRELLSNLLQQYPQATPVVRLLIERLATNSVKLSRLERVDNALFQNARLFAEDLARLRPENSVAALLPDTPDGRANAVALMSDAALPPVERSNNIERARLTLERQIVGLVEKIERLYRLAPISVSAVPVTLSGHAEAHADISDATVAAPCAVSAND